MFKKIKQRLLKRRCERKLVRVIKQNFEKKDLCRGWLGKVKDFSEKRK